ncbi:hypothetical protein [Fusibacillus kribbianus]|uniref:Uncharacterized protein n=1 Tax=Fusibacillus kribbianus TaxID=3044208 RepID=A0AAP4F036_9FIRM|nr:hypothetical protein [Ruminococcus sp. YH-rum2234]MDI9242740.1 hypothetical protein [Ruminococcus sp. YH-rum2234]
MLVLKLIGKILLLPVWVILAITWLVVHILVSIFSIFHGFWKGFFTLFTVLAIALGMYQNAIIFVGAIAFTYVILVAGAMVDVLLEEAMMGIGRAVVT